MLQFILRFVIMMTIIGAAPSMVRKLIEDFTKGMDYVGKWIKENLLDKPKSKAKKTKKEDRP